VVGAQQGLHRSPNHGASVEFAEYREYRPGDPPNMIDWAVYGRSDRYMIRRFQEETNLRGHVLLDTSESLSFKSGGPMTKLEYACYLAASMLFILVRQGDTAGLMTFDGAVRDGFAPVGSFEGLRPMLHHLEKTVAKGPSDIEAGLHEAAGRLKSRSLVIVISDLLQPADGILRGLRHLQHDGHDVTVFQVLDPGELELGLDGLAELTELETGRRLLVDAGEMRDSYRKAVERHLDRLRHGCTQSMVDYLQVSTRMPVEEAVHLRARRS
ncbi:MAG TPA: DUF58 domain-containing protein, partial [Verrucomicrobiae bacterium]|nr:DUF58 domain-containing protein [Verrucomicrobiae bacterium]